MEALYKDILSAPHTLIAGTTGSGKSNVLNGILRELMETRTPQEAQYILIDPKRVELSPYKKTEYCMGYTAEVLPAIGYLDTAIDLIESRYQQMETAGTKDYIGTNVYIVIDELADLMISPQSRTFSLKLQKILQIGRASAVHVIAATQAPNRGIIPANVVLNFTNRVALRCLAGIESRQIINQNGAEDLPKYGKALYLSPDGIKRVDIPLTPDNSDLIAKHRRAETAEQTPQETTTAQPVRETPQETRRQTVSEQIAQDVPPQVQALFGAFMISLTVIGLLIAQWL